jgi:hypothetical protein
VPTDTLGALAEALTVPAAETERETIDAATPGALVEALVDPPPAAAETGRDTVLDVALGRDVVADPTPETLRNTVVAVTLGAEEVAPPAADVAREVVAAVTLGTDVEAAPLPVTALDTMVAVALGALVVALTTPAPAAPVTERETVDAVTLGTEELAAPAADTDRTTIDAVTDGAEAEALPDAADPNKASRMTVPVVPLFAASVASQRPGQMFGFPAMAPAYPLMIWQSATMLPRVVALASDMRQRHESARTCCPPSRKKSCLGSAICAAMQLNCAIRRRTTMLIDPVAAAVPPMM